MARLFHFRKTERGLSLAPLVKAFSNEIRYMIAHSHHAWATVTAVATAPARVAAIVLITVVLRAVISAPVILLVIAALPVVLLRCGLRLLTCLRLSG